MMDEVEAGHEYTKVQLAELVELRRTVAEQKDIIETCSEMRTLYIAEIKEFSQSIERWSIRYKKDIDEQSALIEKLAEAVHSAAETFSEYASIHAAKEPPDTRKAEFNQWRCDQMREALAAYEQWKDKP